MSAPFAHRCATCDRVYNSAWWHTFAWWHRARSVAYEWMNMRIVFKPVDNASYVLDRMTAAFRETTGAVRDWTLQARASRKRQLWARLRSEAGLERHDVIGGGGEFAP